ncbi:bifunctional serine/threonine-protein kinase/formylglycine-generating enzyme family protein [Urbifossiella limnaea]|uniref:Serine/threonine-protein kinase PknB n=1 Tax=Urbifossiella limnaea TaxID=2528023 RepID=A0A517Y066_9BACT|nr:bifunctional serine/threonine-protein kinase/formylglycine-generating enzyme family protein [Urbifossiella limnaea]QDU23149.1 Serine/threonine-protein kinase PknB [Urbifossiella limnaea]
MSPAADPTAAFLSSLRGSGLLTPAQADDLAAWATQTKPDPTTLAKEVARRGWLTNYQIKEVFRGRGKDLLVDRYVLLDLLGEGGMGRVFKAHDTRLARDVALKIIRKERLSNPAAVARFGHEMVALGQLQHPNVVKAFDASQTGDTHFVVMEFIDGQDLTKIVQARGPLPLVPACEAVRQAALGLHHAYEAGMVHRDIKPSNILVTPDWKTAKLVDLGLARLDEPGADARVTQEGFVIGTPDFLAPEQARDPGSVDIRADIYALGATLYYVLTGKVPFSGANPTEKLLKHCTEPPPALRVLRPDAPPQLEALIHWCMAKRPEDRPQTPMQLAAALAPFCPAAPRPSGPHPVAPPLRFLPAPAPVPAPLPLPNPHSSSQVFRLPDHSADNSPVLQRARPTFPWAMVGIGAGILFVVAVLGFAGYRAVFGNRLGPVDSFTNAAGMKMVKLDGGTFVMGSPPGEPGRPPTPPGEADPEGPPHEVTIGGPFLMAATEVTFGQYWRVMNNASPRGSVSKARGANQLQNHPVEGVSFGEAVEFCKRLTERDRNEPHARPGWAYRLPTEAEWEYAARAGTTAPFGVGEGGTDKLVYRPQVKSVTALYTVTGADPCEDADPIAPLTLPGKAGSYPPNRWGLYDMHGNVAEWCHDWFKPGYPADGPRTDPTGPSGGDKRVVRGGSFRDPASACRSAARKGVRPFDTGGESHNPVTGAVGFRVVYAPSPKG